jgi:selenoprotein W-related protein
MTDVEIEYCVPCGHLPRAQDLQGDILEEFGLQIDGVRLKTGDGGVFKVSVDDEVIYDKAEDGDLDRDALIEAINARTSATA